MFSGWQIDLLFSGWSIARKGRVFKDAWTEHLLKSKEFINTALKGNDSLHVLGAGRLLDFPLNEVKRKYKEIHLYDADRGAIGLLRATALRSPSVKVHQVELSDGLANFKKKLSSIIEVENVFTRSDFKNFDDVPAISPLLNIGQSADVISLNILSQLPLAYRLIFEKWVAKNHGRKFIDDSEKKWLEEYNVLGAKIVHSHLKLLLNTAAKNVVVISDTEQLFNPLSELQLPRPKKESFTWEVEGDAITKLEVTSSLCGVDLMEAMKKNLPSYKIRQSDFWSWYLTPATRERAGVICRVDAVKLEKV